MAVFEALESDPGLVDLELFGLWLDPAGYQPTEAREDTALRGVVDGVLLEIKSAELLAAEPPVEDMRETLNEMTEEMRGQFGSFRDMRKAADRLLAGGDEAAQKLARADIKAATDAMSVIIRTLEKIDSLQRLMARDREDAAERAADAGSGTGAGHEEAVREVQKLIEKRAAELFDTWRVAALSGADLSGGSGADAGDGTDAATKPSAETG